VCVCIFYVREREREREKERERQKKRRQKKGGDDFRSHLVFCESRLPSRLCLWFFTFGLDSSIQLRSPGLRSV
jgi:hypothetical protein